MARRSNNYPSYYAPLAGYPQSPSVLAAILYTIGLFVVLFVLVVALGPFIDFFSNWMMTSTLNVGNPYLPIAMDLFTWCYIFIGLVGAVGFIIIWRAVIQSIIYGRVG
jgi:hypothetical protein